MKVSELISKLQDIINSEGDVDVKIIIENPTPIIRNIAVGMEAAGIDCILTESESRWGVE